MDLCIVIKGWVLSSLPLFIKFMIDHILLYRICTKLYVRIDW